MSRSKGSIDSEATKRKKSESAKLRWANHNAHKIQKGMTIESAMLYLIAQSEKHSMEFLDFVEGYYSVLTQTKK